MSGVIPLLPLYALMVWTGAALPDDCNVVWNYLALEKLIVIYLVKKSVRLLWNAVIKRVCKCPPVVFVLQSRLQPSGHPGRSV
jgi:hypothetical protein